MNESSTSKFLAGLFLFVALTGCTSVMDVKRGTPLDRSEMWVLLLLVVTEAHADRRAR